MQVFKENIILSVWAIIAITLAIIAHNKSVTEPEEPFPPSTQEIFCFNFSEKQKQETDSIFSIKHKYGKFNGVVLVGQKDSIFYSNIFGYTDCKKEDTLSIHHSFQLASVSKQFTAVAILQLYEKGLLNLSDTIQHFFPDFPYKGITIRQLLLHRSGLPNYHYFLQHIPTDYDTVITNQDVIKEMIDSFPEPYYRANQRYNYSNTGYAILASIVEKVSQLRFNKYCKKFIFEPLNMKNSFTFLEKNKRFANKTEGFVRKNKAAEDNYLDYVLGDKGIYCSAYDLFKWDQGLYNNKIINYDTLKLAFKPMGKPERFTSNYGYGWRTLTWREDSTKILYHAGWWHGYKTLLLRIPKDTATIIVLRNTTIGESLSLDELLNIFYPTKQQIKPYEGNGKKGNKQKPI